MTGPTIYSTLAERRPSKDRHTLNTSQFNVMQSRLLQKIISSWLIREDLVEGLAFVLALDSRDDADT